MNMELIKTFAMNIAIFAVGGLVLFVPLVNFINAQLGKPGRVSYKIGLLWGIISGFVFSLIMANTVSVITVMLISGVIILASFIYRKFIQK
ncbi:MAG: hypothetical protein ACJAZS_000441 [Alteromonas naphthalenivorans]|jgi:hypothetical protein